MTLLTKILLSIGAVLLLSTLGFVAYKAYEAGAQNDALNKTILEQKQLLDGITRSQANYVSKDDLNAFAAANGVNLAQIQKDVASLNATITGVNNISVSSGGSSGTDVGSTTTTSGGKPEPTSTTTCNGQTVDCSNIDPNGYFSNIQHLALTEPFSGSNVPVGNVSFDASQKAPWSYNLYPRTYNITNVLATDKNGEHYIYNKFNIVSNGSTYTVTVNNAKFDEVYPSPSLSWWNPRLFLGVDGELNVSTLPLTGALVPNVSFGFVSYGKTKISPDFVFGTLGAGYDALGKRVNFQLTPAQYNIGRVIPFVQNTYVGPVIGMGENGNFNVGLSLKVGL